MISGVKITDMASATEAARAISNMGVDQVIITLGAKGALVYTDGLAQEVAAFKVEAVDTTAAGDVFNGALAVAISEERSLKEAVRFAAKAAAISVTRIGAQSSAPYRNEVDVFC
jgi:ribokinase